MKPQVRKPQELKGTATFEGKELVASNRSCEEVVFSAKEPPGHLGEGGNG